MSPPLFLAARNGHRELVALLTSDGADSARCCGPDGTALMAACAANSAECVQALLTAAAAAAATQHPAAADHDARLALATARHPRTGETALHVAARSGAADAARALLEGVSVGTTAADCRARLCWARDGRGRTPAVAAGAAPCGRSSIEVMALLLASAVGGGGLEHHTQQQQQPQHNRTSPAATTTTTTTTTTPSPSSALSPAASYASSSASSPTTTAAIPAAAAAPPGADTTALHLAAARGNGPLCSALLAACGARAAARHDVRGATPLHLAARCARPEAAAILCRSMGFRGVRAARDAVTGATPLHEAAKSLLAPDAASKAAMAAMLVNAGCDPAARDAAGWLACDYDADVMPPVELESRGDLAATARMARDLALERAREDAAAEEEAAAAAAAAAARAEEARTEQGKDPQEKECGAVDARATVVKAIAAKADEEEEAEAAREAAGDDGGWRIGREAPPTTGSSAAAV